jgi:hypothetical protein
MSTVRMAVLQNTNAVNVACQEIKSTCKILVRNNNLPFSMTLLFLTDILRVMEHVFGAETECGPVHQRVLAKVQVLAVNCSGTAV